MLGRVMIKIYAHGRSSLIFILETLQWHQSASAVEAGLWGDGKKGDGEWEQRGADVSKNKWQIR